MQFVVNSYEDYQKIINKLCKVNVYDSNHLMYIIDNTEPRKYPAIASIDIEDSYQDDRHYVYSGVKFIYLDDLLTSSEYIEKLEELVNYDERLSILQDTIQTSGNGSANLDELTELQDIITNLENQLF